MAAEAIAADAANGHAYYVAALFEEGIPRRRATQGPPTSKRIVCTDCRSLYDAIKKVQAGLEEKSTSGTMVSHGSDDRTPRRPFDEVGDWHAVHERDLRSPSKS